MLSKAENMAWIEGRTISVKKSVGLYPSAEGATSARESTTLPPNGANFSTNITENHSSSPPRSPNPIPPHLRKGPQPINWRAQNSTLVARADDVSPTPIPPHLRKGPQTTMPPHLQKGPQPISLQVQKGTTGANDDLQMDPLTTLPPYLRKGLQPMSGQVQKGKKAASAKPKDGAFPDPLAALATSGISSETGSGPIDCDGEVESQCSSICEENGVLATTTMNPGPPHVGKKDTISGTGNNKATDTGGAGDAEEETILVMDMTGNSELEKFSNALRQLSSLDFSPHHSSNQHSGDPIGPVQECNGREFDTAADTHSSQITLAQSDSSASYLSADEESFGLAVSLAEQKNVPYISRSITANSTSSNFDSDEESLTMTNEDLNSQCMPTDRGIPIDVALDGIPDGPVCRQVYQVPTHYYHDFDPESGDFISIVRQPETLAAPIAPGEWRLQNSTSNELIEREIRVREKMAKERSTRGQRLAEASRVPDRQALAFEQEESPYSVKISCAFRPAESSDMEGVARIYNKEVVEGIKTPDYQPLPVEAFLGLLDECREGSKPFIVAERSNDWAGDVSKWPSKEAFNEFQKMLKLTGGKAAQRNELVGFAMLTPFDHGLWCGEGTAFASAMAHVYVDGEHRRQRVGRNLLDLLMAFTVSDYHYKSACYWRCEDAAGIYHTNAYLNDRKYNRVFIANFFRKNDPDLAWTKELLEEQFGFIEMGQMQQAYRTVAGDNDSDDSGNSDDSDSDDGEYLDKVIWGVDCCWY